MAWVFEEPLPFTPTGRIFFSPILNDVIYVIDQGTQFWKYNIVSHQWTLLASPTYGCTVASQIHFNRTLAVSPDGTRLACISEGSLYGAGAPEQRRTGGGRRVEFYTIATNTWTASQQTTFLINGRTTYARALVWENDDTLWVWCVEGYANGATGNVWDFYGKCVRYVPSTDTWTPFDWPTLLLRRFNVGYPWTWYGLPRGAAIKNDGSEVYVGCAYYDMYWKKYTVATNTYSALFSLNPTDLFCYIYDRTRLWFFTAGSTCQQGYLNTADDTLHYDQFTENIQRTAGYGGYGGVRSGASPAITAHARATPPELMSEGSFIPLVQTNPATGVT